MAQQFDCCAARLSVPSGESMLHWDRGYWDNLELRDLILSTNCDMVHERPSSRQKVSGGNFIN